MITVQVQVAQRADNSYPTDKRLSSSSKNWCFKVAEHSFLVPVRYLSLFSNHWQLGSQNWQGAISTKEDCILICFIGQGTVTMATQLVVNRH